MTGQTLTGSVAWNDASCNATPTYAWQEASSGAGPWTTVGTAQTYALTSADVGEYVRFTSTDANGAGSTTSTSQVVGPVTAPTVTTTTTTPKTTSTPSSTTPTSTSTTKATATTATTVRFYRCTRACTLIDTHGAKTYKPTRADYGRYIKIVTTVTRTSDNVRKASTAVRWVGPVIAATAGDISLGLTARPAAVTLVRGSTGKALGQVRIHRRHGDTLSFEVTRTGRAATQVWAYVVSNGARVSGTTPRSLSRPATLTVTLKRGQTVRLVAIRT